MVELGLRERGREGEREGHQCVVASHAPPTGDLAHNPGMCPDWESNQWPLGSQAGIQSTEPHQPGQERLFCGRWFILSAVGKTGLEEWDVRSGLGTTPESR